MEKGALFLELHLFLELCLTITFKQIERLFFKLMYLLKIAPLEAESQWSQVKMVFYLREPYWARFCECVCLALTS